MVVTTGAITYSLALARTDAGLRPAGIAVRDGDRTRTVDLAAVLDDGEVFASLDALTRALTPRLYLYRELAACQLPSFTRRGTRRLGTRLGLA